LAWIALSDRVSREFAQMPDVRGATPIERLNMFGLQSEFFFNPRFNLLVGGPRCPILWYRVVLSRFSSSQKLSCIRSLQSTEPWRPRDVLRAGRPPPRRVARGSRPGGRPSAARRRAARSAVPAGASPRRVATMPKNMVRKKSARRCAFHRRCVHSGCVEFQTFRRSCQSGSTMLCPACGFLLCV
jgi:hypothetical protein